LRRDVRGRFAPRGRRPRKGGRPPRGKRGKSHLARKSRIELARILVQLELEVARLEAECGRRRWRIPRKVTPANMVALRKRSDASVARRLKALEGVLIDMAEGRTTKPELRLHVTIAERMSEKLGEPFGWRRLYADPYRTRWQAFDDWIGREEVVDAMPGLEMHARSSKPVLVHSIGRMRERRDELLALSRERLLASDQPLEPIPDGGPDAIVAN
jgi:hypothetical protein